MIDSFSSLTKTHCHKTHVDMRQSGQTRDHIFTDPSHVLCEVETGSRSGRYQGSMGMSEGFGHPGWIHSSAEARAG
jgi:hypothetical protein